MRLPLGIKVIGFSSILYIPPPSKNMQIATKIIDNTVDGNLILLSQTPNLRILNAVEETFLLTFLALDFLALILDQHKNNLNTRLNLTLILRL